MFWYMYRIVGFRVTMATPLPSFSYRVKTSLEEQRSHGVWGLAINEAADYYLEYFPDISSKQEYTTIGRKMMAEYPSIKREGNFDWVRTIYCFTTLGIKIMSAFR
jgi:hypothetical protein